MSKRPSVSILFLVKNERANLEHHWHCIADQIYAGDVEIIAVDGGSEDGTQDFLRSSGARVIQIAPADFQHAATRNYAAEQAQNEILVLLSGDAIPLNEHWLAALAAPFDDPEVAAAYGRQVPPPSVGVVRTRYMAGEYPETPQLRRRADTERIHLGLFRFSNANGAVRREDWARFRWNEDVLVGEDITMCHDLFMAGRAIAYVPEAAVLHGHGRNLIDEFRFAFDNGYSLRQAGILGNPEYAGATGAAFSRAFGDMLHFKVHMQPHYAAYATAVYAAKWFGVKAGQHGTRLPKSWLRHLSEHLRRRAQSGLD